MPTNRAGWLWIWIALCCGCQSAGSGVAPPPPGPTTQLGAAVQRGDRIDAAMALWHLSLDPDTLAHALEFGAARGAQQNDDLYWLDVRKFFGPDDLRIVSIDREGGLINLTWEVSHPFAPPFDLAAPASAKNRADLGIAGSLLFLVDAPASIEHTYFTDVIANGEAIANADMFYRPAGMLPTTLTANTFPAQVLVDERGMGSRVGVSNGGDVTGNYGADGWTRDEMGPPKDQWTGYGVLHQGQTTRRTVSLDASVLAAHGPISFDLAILVRYNDPRNASNVDERIARRLPPAVPDPLIFAYRMPHGALDCSELTSTTEFGPIIQNDTSTYVAIHMALVDWDARAIASGAADLSEETDVTKVPIGERGVPIANLSFPRIAGSTTIPVTYDPVAPSGRPGDELRLGAILDNTFAEGQEAGIAAGLVRFEDPENSFAVPLALPLDRTTLLPLSSDLPAAITYGAVRIDIQPPSTSWVRQISGVAVSVITEDMEIDPATGRTILCGEFNGTVDFDPGPDTVARMSAGNQDAFIVALSPEGLLEWVVTFGSATGNEQCQGVGLTSTGEIRAAGVFQQTCDFDPGPDTQERTPEGTVDAFCLALDPDGIFQWVATAGGTNATNVLGCVVDTTNRPAICGAFTGTTDLDPGAGMMPITSNGNNDAYLWGLTAAGGYRFGIGWGEAQDEFAMAVAAAPDGSLLTIGDFRNTVDFDPGAGTAELISTGMLDAFLLRVTSTGVYDSALHWGGTDNDIAHRIARNPVTGEFVIGGTYSSDDVDLDPGAGTETRIHKGSGDTFFLTLDSALLFQSVATFGSTNIDSVGGIAFSPTGTLRVAGNWFGAVDIDLDPGPGDDLRAGIGNVTSWMVGLDGTGNQEWGRVWSGALANCTTRDLGRVPDGSLRITGTFSNLVDFDPDPAADQVHVALGNDTFLLKLSSTGLWVN